MHLPGRRFRGPVRTRPRRQRAGDGDAGVVRLRTVAPKLPVTARATLHKTNFREMPRLIDLARGLGLDGISFLPADVTSHAFGRDHAPDASALALNGDEIGEFARNGGAHDCRRTTTISRQDSSPSRREKLRRLPQVLRSAHRRRAVPARPLQRAVGVGRRRGRRRGASVFLPRFDRQYPRHAARRDRRR